MVYCVFSSHESPPYEVLSHLHASVTWGRDWDISLGVIIIWDIRDWQAVHNADVVEDKSTGNNCTCPLRSVLEHSTRTVDTPKP